MFGVLLLGVLTPRCVPRALAQSGATLPDATTPPVPKKGLRLPDIQLHDPWIIADRATHLLPVFLRVSAHYW